MILKMSWWVDIKQEKRGKELVNFEKLGNDEKRTKYVLKQEHKWGEVTQINILVDGNNKTMNTNDEIMKEITLFYRSCIKQKLQIFNKSRKI